MEGMALRGIFLGGKQIREDKCVKGRISLDLGYREFWLIG